jgi:acetyltransferase-like isoleucine patch superfamily enzyme
MKRSLIIDRFWRIIIEKSSSEKKARYLRKQGMKIGERCQLNAMDFSTEPYLVELGDHVAVARGTIFLTHDGAIRCFREEFPLDDVFGPIKIGNNVFIGENCTVLPNTIIGDNCIVGAGSVVRGTFPENSVIFGNPAKIIMPTGAQRLLYKQSKGRLPTAKMSDPAKKPLLIKHFKELNEET